MPSYKGASRNRTETHQAAHSPERALIVALIECAVMDACGAQGARSHEQDQAAYWIEHGDFGKVTYNDACHFIGIDPSHLQARMREILPSKIERRAVIQRRGRQVRN